jgi:GTP:adenosylcobinamide-phosphate guanylyltransferase
MRLWKIKRANPCNEIHPPELGYDLDIQIVFDVIIYRIMTIKSDMAFLMNKWISQVFVSA